MVGYNLGNLFPSTVVFSTPASHSPCLCTELHRWHSIMDQIWWKLCNYGWSTIQLWIMSHNTREIHAWFNMHKLSRLTTLILHSIRDQRYHNLIIVECWTSVRTRMPKITTRWALYASLHSHFLAQELYEEGFVTHLLSRKTKNNNSIQDHPLEQMEKRMDPSGVPCFFSQLLCRVFAAAAYCKSL